MAGRADEDAVRRREAVRGRVKFLLEYHWSGNQRQMARDLGVSQGLISKIVNGLQGAGRQFLGTLARQPGVNADWVLRGEGQPLDLPPKGTLPVAMVVLPRPFAEAFHLLSGQRHPVAEALNRASRYWLELPVGSALLHDDALKLMAGDLLLMESDPAWTGRMDLIEGRLCGVQVQHGLGESTCTLGKLYRDPLGLVFDALHFVIRMATPTGPLPCSASDADVPAPKKDNDAERPRVRARRKVRTAEEERARYEKSRQMAESQREAALQVKEVVAVCVYQARPSPRVGRTESARTT